MDAKQFSAGWRIFRAAFRNRGYIADDDADAYLLVLHRAGVTGGDWLRLCGQYAETASRYDRAPTPDEVVADARVATVRDCPYCHGFGWVGLYRLTLHHARVKDSRETHHLPLHDWETRLQAIAPACPIERVNVALAYAVCECSPGIPGPRYHDLVGASPRPDNDRNRDELAVWEAARMRFMGGTHDLCR